jgi:adenine-specific DNA-methyltransferase
MKNTKKAVSSLKTKDLKKNKGDSSVVTSEASLTQSDMKKTETRVEIKPAKGRPMLTWVGKKPLRHAIAYPAQLVETFHATPLSWKERGRGEVGLLFHGDNKDVLAWLLANGYRGKVKLIYIDPPFDSGADYVRKVNLRGAPGAVKLEGETYTLGEQTQYSDIWANDNYLQFMYERLLMLKELLSDDGSFYLHCDWHKSHHLRCLMDEILGAEHIQNEIVWKRTSARSDSKTYNHIHDTILFYSKASEFAWNKLLVPHPEEYLERYYNYKDEDGRRFTALNLTAPGLRKGSSGSVWRGFDPKSQSSHWKYTTERLDELDAMGKIYWPNKEGGWPRLKNYLDETEGRAIQSIWDDLFTVNSQAAERTEYPTQKSESLVERIIQASSNMGDLVLDCFLGSGTTAAVAQKLGRRWIGADINKGAIQTTVKRLQGVIQEQADLSPQPPLLKEMGSQTPEPAQWGFAVYRVNDYDLQIQHNEAFNLAVEHLGMTRTKTDAFFDGTLGKKLVRIVPFNHPVTPLDLEEVKNELRNRPEEERDIVVVGLGREYAVQAWLDEWNKLRKQGGVPNKIEVIELRSDPRYGGFFTHEPARAKVTFKRVKENVEIAIDDFISPTILERLRQQNKDNPLFQPQVSDWRSMVDSVMIDADYDGEVFNITLADVPERKNDLVEGKYTVEAKKGATSP